MSDLERIVRPFGPGDVFSRARLLPRPQQPTVIVPADETTTWKGSAEGDYVDMGNQWYNGFSSDLKEDRSQRQSRTVRVENPDDPEQHVFVERIDSTVFRDKNGKEQKFTFDWSTPQDGP